MSGSSRRVRRSAGWWRELVAAQPGSGRTVAEFCAARGVGPAGFYAWRRRLAEAAAPGFAAVRVTADARASAVPAATGFEVVLPGGTVLRAPAGCDPETVARLAGALRRQEREAAPFERSAGC